MNENTQTEVIDNFLNLTTNPFKVNLIKNLLITLEDFGIDEDLHDIASELILSSENAELISFNINELLFDNSQEVLSRYGILINPVQIPLSAILNLLNLLIEVPKYDALTYSNDLAVLSSDNDNELKLNNLMTYYYNTPEYVLYDYLIDVTDKLISNLETNLIQSKEDDDIIEEELLDYTNKVIKVYQPLLNTFTVKKVLETRVYDLSYDQQLSNLYLYIEYNLLFDVKKSALEIVAILLLTENIENVYFALDGDILNDMIELDYSKEFITNVIETTKNILTREIKND